MLSIPFAIVSLSLICVDGVNSGISDQWHARTHDAAQAEGGVPYVAFLCRHVLIERTPHPAARTATPPIRFPPQSIPRLPSDFLSNVSPQVDAALLMAGVSR